MILKTNIIKFLLLLLICFSEKTISQNRHIMLTYSKTDLVYSPGFEINYFFSDTLGVSFGISSFRFNNKPNQLVNQTIPENDYSSPFYSGNIGLCGYLSNNEKLQIGWSAGWKMYYGPEFIPLHYYEEGDYYIYFDSSGSDLVGNKFDHGVDLGVFLYLKKYSLGIKYDTARNQIKYLAGWSF
jgi:hypothetical protein